jgi:hypothetical protein
MLYGTKQLGTVLDFDRKPYKLAAYPNNFFNYLFYLFKLLATKFLIDEGENEELYNSDWAKASRMSIKEINALEKKFLNRLNWELYISSDEFWNFTNSLTEK